jgi:hypothetical protein
MNTIENDQFISKVAELVGQKLSPLLNARPVVTSWSNYNTSLPSTSVIGSVNTDPPLPYNNTIKKNDENDRFGNYYY